MKTILTSLIAIIISIDLYCQVSIIDSIVYQNGEKILVKNNPQRPHGVICKFYVHNDILKYKYEFITKLKELSAKEFSNYLNKNELILDGQYIEFFENGDTLMSVNFINGNKVGRQLQFNRDKTLFSELIVKAPNESIFSLYYPNGNKKMQFEIVNNEKEGEETHYFENGNEKLRMLNKKNYIDGELIEYYPDNRIKRKDRYENNKLIYKDCYDKEGSRCSYISLIDTFKLIDQQNQLITLRSNPKIIKYLKENSISFSCLISTDNKLSSIDKGSLPDSIFEIIYDWAVKKVSWKSEIYSDTPVITSVNFTITELDSTYFVFRKPYDTEINNNAYQPSYEIKAYDYVFTDENKALLAEMAEAPFVMVEDMPQFNGGSSDNFRVYIAENLKYPEEAAKKGLQGRVYIQFVVSIDGKIKDVSILRGVHPLLDNEAMRVIRASPKWRPGFQRGKPVNVQFTFPVNFVIQK